MAYQLIMVAPNMEASVSRTLATLNFDHLIFRIRRQVARRGQVVERISPIFPGYIFVLARNAWATIRQIIGVRGFVGFGGQVCDVPDRIVEMLRQQSDEDGVILTEVPVAPFELGEAIQVTLRQGTILTGQFQHLLPPDRATVLVDIMGRMACVNVPMSDCKAMVPHTRRRQRHKSD